ncbi:hypothetical protein [Aureibacillus halotolerans]|uniref:Uncharacterized protein n=1 Tax=Aureibacillus halotolerans TaxID=1508390 RepID=A0A4R6U6L5_9BACI|nr:hypothetical protein [Aureibacillus halotolerans]TDQ42138.1 hypothetical protein EV213_102168 [Aureibacillus halotolerans]
MKWLLLGEVLLLLVAFGLFLVGLLGQFPLILAVILLFLTVFALVSSIQSIPLLKVKKK